MCLSWKRSPDWSRHKPPVVRVGWGGRRRYRRAVVPTTVERFVTVVTRSTSAVTMTVALAGSPDAYVVCSPALCGTPQNVGLFSTLPEPSGSCFFSLFRVAVSCRISTVSFYAVVGCMRHMLLSWATRPVRLRTMSLNSRFVTRVSLPIHHAASHVATAFGC